MSSILIVEDDLSLAKNLKQQLVAKQHYVSCTHNARAARKIVNKIDFDLVIIDDQLPDGNGLDLLTFFNQYHYDLRLIFHSHNPSLTDKLQALKNGADDFIDKNSCWPELYLRIENLLAKNKTYYQQIIKHGPLTLYKNEGILEINDSAIKLRKKEALVFYCLILHHGRVISREKLLSWGWGIDQDFLQDTVVDVHIRRIRKKLGHYADYIRTVRGFGYKFVCK